MACLYIKRLRGGAAEAPRCALRASQYTHVQTSVDEEDVREIARTRAHPGPCRRPRRAPPRGPRAPRVLRRLLRFSVRSRLDPVVAGSKPAGGLIRPWSGFSGLIRSRLDPVLAGLIRAEINPADRRIIS